MDKKKIIILRSEISEALDDVAARNNLKSIKLGNAVFTATSVTFKLECVEEGGLSLEAQTYERNRVYMGLPEVGSVFPGPNNIEYEIIGMKARTGKVIGRKKVDGKLYLFASEQIKQYIRNYQIS